ncbi:Tim44 domain-containing protein [Mesorhizobium sp. LHD-90]|uniref:Tim44 domain-containing protein n=1 Tax=Mesorhizobium sp. LHD-90 TaxID=3071414 RepID=UPI0027E05E85|nr:Tim44 domain-containing protein [Mesorhizobium sp. LHD-90]MDQ6433606.1 Tim44 domain-containing protein [Mesorhizobium sp. LHD-90]
MLNSKAGRGFALMAALFMAFSLFSVDYAEARRGGSFGSRGTRTFQSAPPTRTAPQPTAPVERSMTPNTGTNQATRQPQATQAQRPGGFMNGLGGSLMRGLLIGGLIGLLLGQGFGGLAGIFGFLIQALLIVGAIMLVMRFLRSNRRQEPAMAGANAGLGRSEAGQDDGRQKAGSFQIPRIGGGLGGGAPAVEEEEIELSQDDLDTFQQRLTEVQEAFGREDHTALRRLVTPEMVSYLSEELADNAKNGVRNDVSDVHLVQADIAEAWREGDRDYATAALRYESVDVMRDRATGEVVDGDPEQATETTELWTFTRRRGTDWQLSAIQEVQG